MAQHPGDISTTGILSRTPAEIANVLGKLAGGGVPIRTDLAEGSVEFVSRLRLIDPAHAFIVIDPDANEAANEALLARPRVSFRATPEGWHIEFAAGAPKRVKLQGRPAIHLAFPEILITQQRRKVERHGAPPPERRSPATPLRFLADTGGFISFEGDLVDLSEAGIGFLQYPPGITLEPGTMLKGCRIEAPGFPSVTVDLEVRYSELVTLPTGERALRSGCRFVEPSPQNLALLEAFFKR
jgi:c-di-GMP-binding flagellar brake protein YcgR